MLNANLNTVYGGLSLSTIANGIISRYGGALLLPKTGYIFEDSVGTTAASLDGVVGRVNCAVGSGLYASQATAGYKPRLRKGAVNLLTYSEQFDNSDWIKTDAVVTANAVVAPDGTITADRIFAETTSNYHYARAIFTTEGALTYSIRVRRVNHDWLFFSAPNDSNLTYFNVSSGTFGDIAAGVTASATVLANGWYSIELRFTALASKQISIGIAASNGVGLFLGTGVEAVDVWGAQLETGSTASPYVATTSAPASNLVGPYFVDYDAVDDKLTIPAQASGHAGCTLIRANVGAVQTTTTGVSLASAYDWNADSAGLIVLPDAAVASVTAEELALLQRYANYLGGYTA